MKLIKVEFIEASTEAAFFNVTVEVKRLFKKPLEVTRRARLDRVGKETFFTTRFEWCDTGDTEYEYRIPQEMIVEYEKTINKKHETTLNITKCNSRDYPVNSTFTL